MDETLMAAEILTPEMEISAARIDLWCTSSVLMNVAYWMRIHAGIPQTASVWYAHTVLQQRAENGDRTATRKLAEFDQAATAYEGARVALAGLIDKGDRAMTPIYDVCRGGYGRGRDLALDEARAEQSKRGGAVMVSRDGGNTWTALDTDA